MCGRCGKGIEWKDKQKGFAPPKYLSAPSSSLSSNSSYSVASSSINRNAHADKRKVGYFESRGIALWIQVPATVVPLIFAYSGFESIFSLAGTCKSFNSMYITSPRAEVFWARMCAAQMTNENQSQSQPQTQSTEVATVVQSPNVFNDNINLWSNLFTSWDGDEDDVYMVIPGTESPQTWLEHFQLCYMKYKWLGHTAEINNTFLKYLQVYKKLGNIAYGKARPFSKHDMPIYLIVQCETSPSSLQDQYENMEVWQLRAIKRDEFITSSTTTVVQHFDVPWSTSDITDGLDSENVCYFQLLIITSISPSNESQSIVISYADIAEALSRLGRTVVGFQSTSPRKVMPWDAYFVTTST